MSPEITNTTAVVFLLLSKSPGLSGMVELIDPADIRKK